jgi:hypothetical protein
MFAKLQWDIDQFDEIQREMPDIVEPLGFSAINVCISASSLRNWTVSAFIQRRRSEGKPALERDVVDHIYKYVEQQKMCEDIANTAKHSGFAERQWLGGSVNINLDEATEDSQGGYVLRHLHKSGKITSIALNAFAAMERCWWGELQNLGFAFPCTMPEWRRRKLAAAFGDALTQ